MTTAETTVGLDPDKAFQAVLDKARETYEQAERHPAMRFIEARHLGFAIWDILKAAGLLLLPKEPCRHPAHDDPRAGVAGACPECGGTAGVAP